MPLCANLQIAEDRTFADLARYIFTTLLAMCLPAPSWVSQVRHVEDERWQD